jgi:hypothetical protein
MFVLFALSSAKIFLLKSALHKSPSTKPSPVLLKGAKEPLSHLH